MLFSIVSFVSPVRTSFDSGDESREFLEIESFVHLHISDNGRKSVPHFQFLSCSCIRDFVLNDC